MSRFINTKNTDKKKIILLFVDVSGSTMGYTDYFNSVMECYQQEISRKDLDIICYEWAELSLKISNEHLISICKNKREFTNHQIGCCTQVSCIVDNIIEECNFANENDREISKIILFTDGDISCDESTKTAQAIAKIGNIMPPIELIIIPSNKTYYNESVIMPFTLNGNVVIRLPGSKKINVPAFTRDNFSIQDFISGIRIYDLYTDNDYKESVYSQLRAMTVSLISQDEDYIKFAKKCLNRKKNNILKNKFTELSLLPDFIKDSRLDETIEYLKSNQVYEMDQVQEEFSRLEQIINSHNNFEKLFFEKDNAKELPGAQYLSKDSDIEKEEIYVECPITFELGVPYLVCNKNIKPIDTIDKKDLHFISNNPIKVLDFYSLDNVFGSYFCVEPSKFKDGLDPHTRNNIYVNNIAHVLPIGDKAEHIKYTNFILFKLFFNQYKVCDPDLLFLAIWYYLKYKSSRENLQELIPAFEAQLKVRFSKTWKLSLNGNLLENCAQAPKYCAIWYIIHELPYIRQDNPQRASILRFLDSLDILYAFLNDLYDINIDHKVKDYLNRFQFNMIMRRFKNTHDKPEFLRKMVAINNSFIKVDTENSIVQLSKDDFVEMNKSTLDFNKSENGVCIDTKIINFNRKDSIAYLPVDKKVVEDIIFERSYFPLKIRYLPIEQLNLYAYLSLQNIDLYFDTAKNFENIKKAKLSLGYDFSSDIRDWPIDNKHYEIPKLDSKTMRPYKTINGIPWQEIAINFIGAEERFISYNNLICEFVIKYSKIPTLNEYLLFIYTREVVGKTYDLLLTKKHTLNGRETYYKTTERYITKLPSDVYSNAVLFLDQFNNTIKENDYIEKDVINILRTTSF